MGARQAIQVWRAQAYVAASANGLVVHAADFTIAQRFYGVGGWPSGGLAILDDCPTITLVDDWYEYTDVDFGDFKFFAGFLVQNPTGGSIDATLVAKLDGALLNRIPNG